MRTFIAIELDSEIRDYLAGIQEGLKKTGADVKWVQPQNIHLTLKFLGERDDKKIEKIKEILDAIVREKKCFAIRLFNIGAFPEIDSPRVIWVGIDKGDQETKTIAEELEDKISKIGIPKESRAFSSHITIGRVRSPHNRIALIKSLIELPEIEHKEFRADKITLFKSTLSPEGPTYDTLKEAYLKTT